MVCVVFFICVEKFGSRDEIGGHQMSECRKWHTWHTYEKTPKNARTHTHTHIYTHHPFTIARGKVSVLSYNAAGVSLYSELL